MTSRLSLITITVQGNFAGSSCTLKTESPDGDSPSVAGFTPVLQKMDPYTEKCMETGLPIPGNTALHSLGQTRRSVYQITNY